jgi:hypothetical protein
LRRAHPFNFGTMVGTSTGAHSRDRWLCPPYGSFHPSSFRMRLLAQARNPYSRWWLWIPGSRHRTALCADPLARPGMTALMSDA